MADKAKEDFERMASKTAKGRVETEFTRKEQPKAIPDQYDEYKVKDPKSKPDTLHMEKKPTAKEDFSKMSGKTAKDRVETEFTRQKEEPKEEATPKRNIQDIVNQAMEGNPYADGVLQSVYQVMGGDGKLAFRDGKAYQVGANNEDAIEINLADYLEDADKVLAAADKVNAYGSSKQKKPEEKTQAVPTEQQTAPTSQRQGVSSSSSSRGAIPMQMGGRGQFDELHPEEQRILHRTMAIDAALTADAGNLNKLLNGPYDRAAAIAEMDRDRAYSQYLRSKPVGSGTLKPNEEYEYNDDYGTVLVKNKETGERLYAKDPEGNPMPIQFFNNPEGFRQLMERTYKQAGLKGNQQLKWSPNVRGNFVVIDPQRGVAPLADFVQANANGNLGTAKTK